MNAKHMLAVKRRSGFTLIELLVVIAIIGILAGLLLAGVMVFLKKGPEVKTRNEFLQLSQALQRFKGEYGRYPPAQIRLRANMKDYLPSAQGGNRVDALDDASLAFLSTMFKNLGGVTNIPWAGATPMPAGGIILEGEQCLVFFLGGPPIGGGAPGLMGGFTVDPTNPVSGGGNRKKFIDFEASRLVNRGGNPFPSYIDNFDGNKPYVYFSSTGFAVNPQTGQGTFGTKYDTAFFIGPNTFQATNTLGVKPYVDSSGKYYLPDSFQLISAGFNGANPATPNNGFGPGGVLPPNGWPASQPGYDDYSNFSDKSLGTAP